MAVPSVDEYVKRGNDANARGEHAVAVEFFRNALETKPGWPEVLHNLAVNLYQLGEIDEALNLWAKAAESGNSPFSLGMMAVAVPNSPCATNREILHIRSEWARMIDPETSFDIRKKRRGAHGPLRVGYMCSFFERENYMKPVWPLINGHDREQFEVHLFSDTPPGQIKSGYQPHLRDMLHHTGGMNNQGCAEFIASIKPDLLIDLNAYSRWRRTAVYTLKPARVIASWFNSYATTGLPAVDYLIGDPVVAPPEEDEFYSEEVLRVSSTYLPFEMTYPVPGVAPPPCLKNGYITFGSMAPSYKLTHPTIEAWSHILHGAPAAKLLLKNGALDFEANRKHVLARFAEHGITGDRLLFEGQAPHFEFLQAYEKVDIALDSFPYNGGTSTTEAIWQGVPVLTFYGDRWASRTSASILGAARLSEFVGANVEDYIALAKRLANDPTTPDKLATLRDSMRDHLLSSPVCDTRTFVREMEKLYRHMHDPRG